ncbi:MAG: protein kinase, partial [Actinobacteria bacterium]|nr:protein kinase [Actinomycetota bacterium]
AASRVVSLAVALASALDAAHGLEVVHGDVTPANVVFVDGRPVLADFGLATWVQPGSGRREERRGATPGWAAPERFDGAAPTSASDVYGLGATLWSAATARRPLPHGPLERAAVPRGIDSIVAACCDEEPRRRPSASEVVGLAESERDRRRRYCPDP